MKNPKIWIDADGVIKAIDAPVEPQEPDYGDCEMDATDLNITGAEVYNMRMAGWTKDMQDYQQALAQAKKEGLMFKDQKEARCICPSLKQDSIHDIPEGYCIIIQTSCGLKGVDDFQCQNIENCVCVHDGTLNRVAILKKIEPQLIESLPTLTAGEILRKTAYEKDGTFKGRSAILEAMEEYAQMRVEQLKNKP